jgi:hypothetical protein
MIVAGSKWLVGVGVIPIRQMEGAFAVLFLYKIGSAGAYTRPSVILLADSFFRKYEGD